MENRTINTDFKIGSDETSIFVAPFFFSPKNPLSDSLKYEWKLNNKVIANYPDQIASFVDCKNGKRFYVVNRIVQK